MLGKPFAPHVAHRHSIVIRQNVQHLRRLMIRKRDGYIDCDLDRGKRSSTGIIQDLQKEDLMRMIGSCPSSVQVEHLTRSSNLRAAQQQVSSSL